MARLTDDEQKALVHNLEDIILRQGEQIKKLEAAQRWISVEDRLPEDGQFVIAFDGSVCIISWDNNTWHDLGDVDLPVDVQEIITHWRLLPEPPAKAAKP
jgi:hypothetical protein